MGNVFRILIRKPEMKRQFGDWAQMGE